MSGISVRWSDFSRMTTEEVKFLLPKSMECKSRKCSQSVGDTFQKSGFKKERR